MRISIKLKDNALSFGGHVLVTVGIVNYNSGWYLVRCVDHVLRSTVKNFEIIIVDNGSCDSSLDMLVELVKGFGLTPDRLRVVKNSRNLGPATACNQILRLARGKFVALLACDTVPTSDWLEEGIQPFLSDEKLAIVQCKLILDGTDLIDSVGDYLSKLGFLVHIATPAQDKDLGQFDNIYYIFSIKSAACILKRDIVLELGGFDDDYFIYYEETDLCWRAWLHGYRVALAPNSVVHHSWGYSVKKNASFRSYLRYFHGTKNHLSTLIKNCKVTEIIIMLPLGATSWLIMGTMFALKSRVMDARYVIEGMFWIVKNLKKLITKRKWVQRNAIPLPGFLVKRISPISYLRRMKQY